jgi:hypothetical protein
MRLFVIPLVLAGLALRPEYAFGQTTVSLEDVVKSFSDKQTATLDSKTALLLNVAELRTKAQCKGVAGKVSVDKSTADWLLDATKKTLEGSAKIGLEFAAEQLGGIPAGVIVGVAMPTTLGRCTDPNICSKTLLQDAECERQLVNHTSNIRLYSEHITSKDCAREILKSLKVTCD